ncbi:MAG: hypothetical protein ACRC7N_17780, partial [Clostridium sp.]
MLGWVRIHRGLLKNKTWLEGKGEDKVVLITTLLLATHKEGEDLGEFVISKERLLEVCGKGFSYEVVYSSLIFLEERGFLTFSEKGCNYGIKISNWELYQNTTGTGWIKLKRELLDNFIWRTVAPKDKVVMIIFLLLSNYKSNEWFWNGKLLSLKAGDLITSIKSIMLCGGSGISFQSVRTSMKKLEERGFIKKVSSSTSSLISIIDVSKFINNGDEPLKKSCNKGVTKEQQGTNKGVTNHQQGTNKGVTNHQQGNNKQATTNKNEKNEKNNNNVYKEETHKKEVSVDVN